MCAVGLGRRCGDRDAMSLECTLRLINSIQTTLPSVPCSLVRGFALVAHVQRRSAASLKSVMLSGKSPESDQKGKLMVVNDRARRTFRR